MSEWSAVVKKTNTKTAADVSDKPLTSTENIRKNPLTTKIKADISVLFEEEYGDIIENDIKQVFNDIKPHTILLDKISYVDIECFFYDYFDKERCITLPESDQNLNDDYYDEDIY